MRIVIAPTAMSPPYFSSDELKHTEITLSLACMMNVASPSAMHGSIMRGAKRMFSRFSFKTVFPPRRNKMTHMQDIPCEMTVASAAPRTPKIKIGSSTIFAAAPISTVSIPYFAKPCAVIKAFRPSVSCTKSVPIAYMLI